MKRIALTITFLLALGAGWRIAKACSPDFLRAVFSYVRHPDLPRTEFIDGRLGVLQPTFARSYLVIAYRYLNGVGLNPREREQARDYYKDRGTQSWDKTGADWAALWYAAHPQPNLITGGQLGYDAETNSFFLNCADDAFRTAIHTADERRTTFGATIAAFRSWVEAQETVFRNCSRGQFAQPEEAAADMPPIIRADREYQIAAAYFYAGKYQEALDRFHRIAKDESSPWASISRYLAVRTLLRMPGREEALHSEAASILSDPKLNALQGMTWNLAQRAAIHEKDQDYFRGLAHLLSAQGQDDGLRDELYNYTDMYDDVIGNSDPNMIYGPDRNATVDLARFRDADLTDWIYTFQSRSAAEFDHSLSRWKETHSPAWLLAALEHASQDQAKGNGLLDAAAAIDEASPAYLTARFHLLRFTGARKSLDELLNGSALKDLPSSTNLFRGLRMLAAPNFADFIGFAARKPVMFALQTNVGEVPDDFRADRKSTQFFDADTTVVLNRKTPFRLLNDAALGGQLNSELRHEALLVAFTRGLMLNADLSKIATQLAGAEPYLRESGTDGKRFAAAFFLLHHPEARPYFATGISRHSDPGKIDDYRDNWWCPMDIETTMDSRVNDQWSAATPNLLQRSTKSETPEFLSGAAAAEAKSEMDKLGKLSAATDFLGGIVLQFAKSHPDDPRVPEALSEIVRAGRYGCADVDTWKTTRSAFQSLQLKYPKSDWAKRTPTWFKSEQDIRAEVKSRER
jgi:TolA-binding protein